MDKLQELYAAARNELVTNVLPFSMHYVMDRENGGFYGYVANDNTVRKEAPKGLIQHSRMLWTFAHAQRTLGDPAYRPIADHARQAKVSDPDVFVLADHDIGRFEVTVGA